MSMGLKRRNKTETARALSQKLETIVPLMFEAEKEFGRLNGIDDDETFEEAMGTPATEKQILRLERYLGRALPPSYRAFLSLYNGGYFGFGGGAKLLGTEDHQDPHIVDTLGWKKTMFDEFEPVNPMDAEVIPLVVGDSRNMVLLEPPMREDGEWDVVTYYLTEEEGRHRDLLQFLQSKLDRMQELVRPNKRRHHQV